MRALKLLLLLGVVIGGLYALLQYRGREVAHQRLHRLHIVNPSCTATLLYSSGIWRESTHVFLTKRQCLVGDAAKPNLEPLPPGDEFAQGKLWRAQQAVKHASRDIDLNAYNYFFGFDDASHTIYYIAISMADDSVYVVIQSL